MSVDSAIVLKTKERFEQSKHIPWLGSHIALIDGGTLEVEVTTTARTRLPIIAAQALEREAESDCIVRSSRLSSLTAGEVVGLGKARYPVDGLANNGCDYLLSQEIITYEGLEQVYGSTIKEFQDAVSTRLPTRYEAVHLRIGNHLPVFELKRLTLSDNKPLSHFIFVCRSDRFIHTYKHVYSNPLSHKEAHKS